MSQAVRSMFDSIAERYDRLNHALSLGRDAAWRRKAASLVPSRPGAKILDLCGGTGDFCQALELHGAKAVSTVGDFSLPMLRLGKRKGISANWVVLDALAPPFREETFDVVLCGFGMRNLDRLSEG